MQAIDDQYTYASETLKALEMGRKSSLERTWTEEEFNFRGFMVNLVTQTLKRAVILSAMLYFIYAFVNHFQQD